jgi:hypothetical protein
MVNVAQMVEHQIVALGAVGSIPTIHPNFFEIRIANGRLSQYHTAYWNIKITAGCGANGSALALGARGCQFESGHPDQK